MARNEEKRLIKKIILKILKKYINIKNYIYIYMKKISKKQNFLLIFFYYLYIIQEKNK